MRGRQESFVFKHKGWHIFQLLWVNNNNNNNIDTGILVASLLWPREFAPWLGVSKKVSRVKIDSRYLQSSLNEIQGVFLHKIESMIHIHIQLRYFFDMCILTSFFPGIFTYSNRSSPCLQAPARITTKSLPRGRMGQTCWMRRRLAAPHQRHLVATESWDHETDSISSHFANPDVLNMFSCWEHVHVKFKPSGQKTHKRAQSIFLTNRIQRLESTHICSMFFKLGALALQSTLWQTKVTSGDQDESWFWACNVWASSLSPVDQFCCFNFMCFHVFSCFFFIFW